jgi:hypothetical protein
MKVQSFMGKVSSTGLKQMDNQINDWLQRSKVKPVQIKQSFGTDIHHEGRVSEPIVIITVWYEEDDEEKN